MNPSNVPLIADSRSRGKNRTIDLLVPHGCHCLLG
jgi:hypothetical protein